MSRQNFELFALFVFTPRSLGFVFIFYCKGGKCFHSKLLWLKKKTQLEIISVEWSLPQIPKIQWALKPHRLIHLTQIFHVLPQKQQPHFLSFYFENRQTYSCCGFFFFKFLLDASNFIANNIQILSFFHCSIHILTEFSHSVTLK